MSIPTPENVQQVDEVDAALAEAEGGRTVEAFGIEFAVADKIGLAPLVRFAQLAKKGVQSSDMAGLAIMGDVIASVLKDDDEYQRFMDVATENRADDRDMLEVVKAAISVMTARPTTRPGGSSAGPSNTGESSTAFSDFEDRKRAFGLVPITAESLAS